MSEGLIDDMKENFLDTVFDAAAKLQRKEYMDLIVEKTPWIFSSKELRVAVDKKIGK